LQGQRLVVRPAVQTVKRAHGAVSVKVKFSPKRRRSVTLSMMIATVRSMIAPTVPVPMVNKNPAVQMKVSASRVC
tara:strand:- start:3706 stop:3930 length:225 start_codon:yes stop_codon:yes gene_type:complete